MEEVSPLPQEGQPDGSTPQDNVSEELLRAGFGRSLSEQADKVLTEEPSLSARDVEFLKTVRNDFKTVFGTLVPNPDGTWAPMNPDPVPQKVDSRTGKVSVKPGYVFVTSETTYTSRRDGSVVKADELTHKLSKRIMKEDPQWFRMNMRRGWHEEGSAYWH